jgi:hypothetical protein
MVALICYRPNTSLLKTIREVGLVGALLSAAIPTPSMATDWYVGIPAQCASNLSTTFVAGGPLDKLVAPTDRTSFVGNAAGVHLVYRLLSSDLPKPRSHYKAVVLTLDQKAKADLELALTRAASKDALPMLEGAADYVLAIAPEVVGYTWDVVWAAAKAALDVKPLNVEAVVPLLAVGGQITRDTVIQRKPDGELWADIFWSYHVTIGVEARSILLASCRMPVEAAPTTILTHEPIGNKRVTIQNGVWQIYDLEDKKYDTPLHSFEQDAEWIYANELGADGSVLNQYRFSNSGIGWQTISSGKWRFLVKNITFE